MTINDHLACGHCGYPLDLCDCGVDSELVYRPQGADFTKRYRAQVDYSSRGWIALALGLGTLMVLRVLIIGWS